jgi:hypothetical protein
MGAPGGLLDAKDQLSAGPVALITDPALSVNNPNNPTHTAGTTFFGQFVDHDITFDVGSRLGQPTDPQEAVNGRTAASTSTPSTEAARRLAAPLRLRRPGEAEGRVRRLFEDLPRAADLSAFLGDPRNDEHVIIAGMHCAFLLFHNKAVDALRLDGHAEADVFAAARRATTWHYQWLVLREFLPVIVGQALVDDVLANGRRFYRPALGQR